MSYLPEIGAISLIAVIYGVIVFIADCYLTYKIDKGE